VEHRHPGRAYEGWEDKDMRRIPTARMLRPGTPGRGSRRPPTPSWLGPGAPAARLSLTELPRAALDLAALTAVAPALAADRRGDGHPVLVLPGLVGGDASTLTLRRYLTWLNYSVSGGGRGMNGAPTEALVSGLRARLQRLAETSGEPVTLIGWSLGGLYAHELARRAPGSVRQVVTLGSPVRLARSKARATSQLFDRFSHLHVAPSLVARPWSEPGPLRVPATSIYTRSDGIVSWQACLLRAGKRRENVEVYGSHLGLALNPTVLHVLAARLAQPVRTWRPFRPGPLTRHLYP